jgi:hypothetical protein
VALSTGEPFVINGNPELLGHVIDVLDIEVDQCVRPSVALVLRQVKPDIPRAVETNQGKSGPN